MTKTMRKGFSESISSLLQHARPTPHLGPARHRLEGEIVGNLLKSNSGGGGQSGFIH